MKFKSEKKLIAFEWVVGIIFAVIAFGFAHAYVSNLDHSNFLLKHSMFCKEQSAACKTL